MERYQYKTYSMKKYIITWPFDTPCIPGLKIIIDRYKVITNPTCGYIYKRKQWWIQIARGPGNLGHNSALIVSNIFRLVTGTFLLFFFLSFLNPGPVSTWIHDWQILIEAYKINTLNKHKKEAVTDPTSGRKSDNIIIWKMTPDLERYKKCRQ